VEGVVVLVKPGEDLAEAKSTPGDEDVGDDRIAGDDAICGRDKAVEALLEDGADVDEIVEAVLRLHEGAEVLVACGDLIVDVVGDVGAAPKRPGRLELESDAEVEDGGVLFPVDVADAAPCRPESELAGADDAGELTVGDEAAVAPNRLELEPALEAGIA